MERGSKYKAQPLRSTLTPETEKRLLGNLKPPKNKYSQSNKPTKIEHVDPTLITAPKASEDMSKLASFQEFTKAFVALENEIKLLRQFSCPPNADKMFDSVAEIKGSIPIFETHCKTIAKQKKLQTEVSKKSFDYYKDFVQQFQLFSDKMHIFANQIHQLYSYGITQAFHAIEDAIESFYDISNKDPQSRSICLQYKKYCDKSLNYLGETLAYFIDSKTFDGFDEDGLAKFAEKAKTFGRFFEKELYPVVAHSLPSDLTFGNCISLFHDNYTKIVPLIVSAPRFLQNFSVVMSKLDKANECIQQVKKEIGDESILKQKKQRKAIIVMPEDQDDDIESKIMKIADLFNVIIDNDDSNAVILEHVYSQASQKINEYKERIRKLELEISRPKPTSKDEYKNQFSEIRKFKDDIEAKIAEENASFNRNLIYSIKSIIPNCKVDVTMSYTRQIQSIVTQLREFIANSSSGNSVEDYNTIKDIIQPIYSPELEEPLKSMVNKSIQILVKENNSLKDKLNNIMKENKQFNQKLSSILQNDLSVSDENVKNKVNMELIEQLEKSLITITDEIKRSRAEAANTLQAFISSRDKLAKSLNIDVGNYNVESAVNDIETFSENIKTKIANSVIFQQNVFIFITKLIDVLQLQNVSIAPQATVDEINKVMQMISQKFDHPNDTSEEIINSNPQKGLFKDVSQYKNMAIKLCNKLINDDNEENNNNLTDKVYKLALNRIEELQKNNVFVVFDDLIVDKISQTKNEQILSLKQEINDYRQNNVQLHETHKILQSIIQQLSNDATFTPNTPQLIALKAFSAHLDKLTTDKKSKSNDVIEAISNLNNIICEKISEHKFI